MQQGVPEGTVTVKKIEAVPNEPATPVDTEQEAQQVDIMETQREVLSESHSYPVVLITIGLLIIIIAVIAWRVFLVKGRHP